MIGYIACLAVCILSWGTVAGAAAEPASPIVQAKRALAARYADEYNPAFARTAEGQAQNDRAEELFAQMVCGLVDEDAALEQLEDWGLHKLDMEVVQDPATRSQPSNVTLNNAAIMYNGGTGQWWVGGGGYWNSDAAWYADSNGTGNVGGYDGIGVKLYNTSGTYNTQVIESYAYISNGMGFSGYVYNPSISDGRQGAFFEYQDETAYHPDGYNSRCYMGRHFSCTIKYNSNFTNFNGYARTAYAHTWSSADISSIGFGLSSSPNFSISFSSSSDKFTCYSTGETRF